MTHSLRRRLFACRLDPTGQPQDLNELFHQHFIQKAPFQIRIPFCCALDQEIEQQAVLPIKSRLTSYPTSTQRSQILFCKKAAMTWFFLDMLIHLNQVKHPNISQGSNGGRHNLTEWHFGLLVLRRSPNYIVVHC